MSNRLGQQFGNYRLLRFLGRGGFAEVFLGEHVYLQTQAALKVMSTTLVEDNVRDFHSDFRKEAFTIAHLVHPHIVRVLEFGVERNVPYLVMDYAPGGTLRMLHPSGQRLPLNLVRSYVAQITSALQYAHQKMVIHRDIKPENMLVGEHNEVLLSDFGLALIAQNSRSQNTPEFAGTLYYMAPEHIHGKPRLASDQYALGIVVYEWLCGVRPFSGSFTELCAQHMFAPPPSLREHSPMISPVVEQVVMTALAKNPGQRFSSIQAFATAFEQACQEQGSTTITQSDISTMVKLPIQIEEVPPTKPPSLPLTTPPQDLYVQLRPPNAAITSSSTPRGPTVGPQPLERATEESRASAQPLSPPIVRVTSSNNFPIDAPTIPTLPDRPPLGEGAQALFPPPSAKSGMSRRTMMLSGLASLAGLVVAGTLTAYWIEPLRAHGRETPTPQPSTVLSQSSSPSPSRLLYSYPGHSGAIYRLAWSPDGRRIASASEDKTVQVWDATHGGSLYIYRGHSAGVQGVAWAPDGKRIASASWDKTVQVWDAANGANTYTYTGHPDKVLVVAWSPDGKRIASAGVDPTVQVWDAIDGTNPYIYQGHSGGVGAVAWSPDGKRIASGSSDKTVRVWDALDGANPYIYKGHSDAVCAVAWSPDGKRIASASLDKTVRVWNATDTKTLYVYKHHSDTVYGVAWSPDNQRIASAGYDANVLVWNATNGTTSYTYDYSYKGSLHGVFALAWSPDGKRIAFGGDRMDSLGSAPVPIDVWQIV